MVQSHMDAFEGFLVAKKRKSRSLSDSALERVAGGGGSIAESARSPILQDRSEVHTAPPSSVHQPRDLAMPLENRPPPPVHFDDTFGQTSDEAYTLRQGMRSGKYEITNRAPVVDLSSEQKIGNYLAALSESANGVTIDKDAGSQALLALRSKLIESLNGAQNAALAALELPGSDVGKISNQAQSIMRVLAEKIEVLDALSGVQEGLGKKFRERLGIISAPTSNTRPLQPRPLSQQPPAQDQTLLALQAQHERELSARDQEVIRLTEALKAAQKKQTPIEASAEPRLQILEGPQPDSHQVSTLRTQNALLEKRLAEALRFAQGHDELQSQHQALRDEHRELQTQHQDLQTAHATLGNEASGQVASLTEQVKQARSDNSALEQRVLEQQHLMMLSADEDERRQTEIAQLKEKLEGLQHTLQQKLEAQAQTHLELTMSQQREMDELRGQIDVQSESLKKLEGIEQQFVLEREDNARAIDLLKEERQKKNALATSLTQANRLLSRQNPRLQELEDRMNDLTGLPRSAPRVEVREEPDNENALPIESEPPRSDTEPLSSVQHTQSDSQASDEIAQFLAQTRQEFADTDWGNQAQNIKWAEKYSSGFAQLGASDEGKAALAHMTPQQRNELSELLGLIIERATELEESAAEKEAFATLQTKALGLKATLEELTQSPPETAITDTGDDNEQQFSFDEIDRLAQGGMPDEDALRQEDEDLEEQAFQAQLASARQASDTAPTALNSPEPDLQMLSVSNLESRINNLVGQIPQDLGKWAKEFQATFDAWVDKAPLPNVDDPSFESVMASQEQIRASARKAVAALLDKNPTSPELSALADHLKEVRLTDDLAEH